MRGGCPPLPLLEPPGSQAIAGIRQGRGSIPERGEGMISTLRILVAGQEGTSQIWRHLLLERRGAALIHSASYASIAL
jgi:hypothetical protein